MKTPEPASPESIPESMPDLTPKSQPDPLPDPQPDLQPDLPDVLAQACQKFGLNDDEIKAVQAEVLGAVEASLNADAAAREQERAALLAELKDQWGEEAQAGLDAAARAAQAFGLDDDDLEDLLECGNPQQIIPALARVGQALATLDDEAGTSGGEMPGQGGRLTAEAAQSELTRLAGDRDHRAAFLNRAHPGHAAAKAQRAQLIAAVQRDGAGAAGGRILG